MNTRRKITLVILAVVALVAGCGSANDSQNQPFNDAGTTGQPDMTNARIYAMPDGFNNIAVKCVNGTAIVTLYHSTAAYGGVFVSEHSALCTGK